MPWVEGRDRGLRSVFADDPGCTLREFTALFAPPRPSRVASEMNQLANEYREEGILPARLINYHTSRLHALDILSLRVRAMRPCFEEALRFPSVTAWVCCNDDMAAAALEFLRQHGKRVPADISLVGFDNNVIAHQLGIDSYDFPVDTMGCMAMECLAHPTVVPRDEEGATHLEGIVVARQSVRAVR
jgi:DNA-binding LacI/PurR family transcriptional regulator